MWLNILVIFLFASLIGACISNPINRATSDNYAETCSIAEERGDLETAEEACNRALLNANWGNLGDELKSEKLYNLSLIKRKLSKFSEAEALLKESLKIEESKSTVLNMKIGRRLVELSVNLAAQGKWDEGSVFLEKMIPVSNQYSGQEKEFVILSLAKYGEHFKKIGNVEKGNAFTSMANEL